MLKILFTERGLNELKRQIERQEATLRETTKEKGDAGVGQDGWHDEGYKLANVDEMMWSQRLGELQKLEARAEVVLIQDQCKEVRIGNGVVVKYDDGKETMYYVDGYQTELVATRVSYHSPIGKLLLMAKIGDVRSITLKHGVRKFTISRIIPPSEAEMIFFNDQGGG